MTGAEYHSEELKKREEKKEAKKELHVKPEKLLTLNSKISEHDLLSKIAKCVKWIEKLHEVRVSVSGDEGDKQKMERIASTIEEGLKPVDGRILQKREKNGILRFSIMPTIKKETAAPAAAPTSNKKLLEDETPPTQAQQARSHHTMAF